MKINIFDQDSGKYIGTSIADESPLEPGEFLIPGNATTAPVPHLNAHEAAIINSTLDGWSVIADYVGVEYWLADGSLYSITELGVSPPADALYAAPFASGIARQLTVTRIKGACTTYICSGIDHDGYKYPTTRDDQANLNGLVSLSQVLGDSGAPYKFWCADAQDLWARRGHTVAQIQSLGLAVARHVINAQDKYECKLKDIETVAADPAAIKADFDAIVW